jgi:hypothetical protein
MLSRYGSQALAVGLRPGDELSGEAGVLANSAPKSVITPLAGFAEGGSGVAGLAAFTGAESVITSLAGFAAARPHFPGGRKAIPAAFRYAAAVSRRTPVARWMRRRDHPSRPNAMTCCLFCSLKTLLTSSEGIALALEFNVLGEGLSLAGFQVIMYGRFWVFTEG